METNLTVPQMKAYRAYWTRHPPTHVIAAAFAGYKPPEKPHQPPIELPDIEE